MTLHIMETLVEETIMVNKDGGDNKETSSQQETWNSYILKYLGAQNKKDEKLIFKFVLWSV